MNLPLRTFAQEAIKFCLGNSSYLLLRWYWFFPLPSSIYYKQFLIRLPICSISSDLPTNVFTTNLYESLKWFLYHSIPQVYCSYCLHSFWQLQTTLFLNAMIHIEIRKPNCVVAAFHDHLQEQWWLPCQWFLCASMLWCKDCVFCFLFFPWAFHTIDLFQHHHSLKFDIHPIQCGR